MERLKFTDDLLTGIDEIDNQHRELLARGNSLLFPEAGRMWSKDILDGLEFLIRYVNVHFSTEERLMEYYEYTKREGHKKQHQRLRSEVEALYCRAKKQTDSVMPLAGELHFLLNDWYIYHIREWDKGYADYLQKRVGLDSIKISGFESFESSEIEIIKIDDRC